MARWYKAYACHGNANEIITAIGDRIQKKKLAKYVPVVRCERQPQRDFYLFVGIESNRRGAVPPEVEAALLHLPLGTRSSIKPFDRQPVFALSEIKTMVGAEHQVCEYGRHVRYWKPLLVPPSDPFDQPDEVQALPNDPVTHDKLLFWLSASGHGSFETFCRACWALGLETHGEFLACRRLLRELRLLGHLETSRDGRAWCVAPPVLVRGAIPSAWILSGSRDTQLLCYLRGHASVDQEPQPHAPGPSRTLVRPADGAWPRTAVPASVQVEESPTFLADAVPDWRSWVDALSVVPGVRPSLFRLREFDGSSWQDAVFSEGVSGFFEMTPRDGADRQHISTHALFWDAPRGCWRQGDWYGLRFASLCVAGRPRIVRYEHGTQRLAIPQNARMPELYERVLTLASGSLPAIQNRWLIYDGIIPKILDRLESALGLDVEKN